MRRYNMWAGNPKGTPENTSRCIEEIYEQVSISSRQCSNKRGQGKEGLYCTMHAKDNPALEDVGQLVYIASYTYHAEISQANVIKETPKRLTITNQHDILGQQWLNNTIDKEKYHIADTEEKARELLRLDMDDTIKHQEDKLKQLKEERDNI